MGLFNRNRSPEDEHIVSGITAFQHWMAGAHAISKNKITTQDEKRARLSDHLDTLEEELFTEYFPLIMNIVQPRKQHCEPFENTEAQVSNICSWLKRMNDNRELLTLFIKERREEYGLEI